MTRFRLPALNSYFGAIVTGSFIALMVLVIVIVIGLMFCPPAQHPKLAMDGVIAAVLVDLQREESFRPKPYPDSRGTATIGWGTAIGEGITRTEGAYLLRERLVDTRKRMVKAWTPFEAMPAHVQVALLDMGYQLGVEGVLEFHDMLAALVRGDYAAARAAALDSEWARETAARARRVVEGLRQ